MGEHKTRTRKLDDSGIVTPDGIPGWYRTWFNECNKPVVDWTVNLVGDPNGKPAFVCVRVNPDSPEEVRYLGSIFMGIVMKPPIEGVATEVKDTDGPATDDQAGGLILLTDGDRT